MSNTALLFTSSIIAAIAITIIFMSLIEDPFVPEPQPIGFSPAANGTFHYPRDVALNSTGDIFVLDTLNNRVQIFNPSGGFNATFGFAGNNSTNGSFNQPYGISINSTDFIHVANTFNNVIKVFSPGGSYLKTIGIEGTGVGEYYYPSGLTQNDTHIFIADTFNNRIQITDLSGNTVDTIP